VNVVCHSFYCSVYLNVLSDIHCTALFTSLYWLTFILLLCLPQCFVWHSLYCSVYPMVLTDIHFIALFTSMFCLTFTVLLCLPHCIVWHSFCCSVYLIVLSDIHSTALLKIQWGKQRSKVNVRQYNGVNRGVKWMSENIIR
jgi:cellulose synthase/poly-beta-1,6-N-acetylglucosamine synthase-like glycosyltransferase